MSLHFSQHRRFYQLWLIRAPYKCYFLCMCSQKASRDQADDKIVSQVLESCCLSFPITAKFALYCRRVGCRILPDAWDSATQLPVGNEAKNSVLQSSVDHYWSFELHDLTLWITICSSCLDKMHCVCIGHCDFFTEHMHNINCDCFPDGIVASFTESCSKRMVMLRKFGMKYVCPDRQHHIDSTTIRSGSRDRRRK